MTRAALTRARLPKATRFRPAAHTSPLLAHGADRQGALIDLDPVAEHLAARVSHGPYRAREVFPVLQVVIDRALLLLVGILRPAMPPFQELIAADLVLLPPAAERAAVGVAELRYGVGRAAAKPCERLDVLRSLLCAVYPYGLERASFPERQLKNERCSI